MHTHTHAHTHTRTHTRTQTKRTHTHHRRPQHTHTGGCGPTPFRAAPQHGDSGSHRPFRHAPHHHQSGVRVHRTHTATQTPRTTKPPMRKGGGTPQCHNAHHRNDASVHRTSAGGSNQRTCPQTRTKCDGNDAGTHCHAPRRTCPQTRTQCDGNDAGTRCHAPRNHRSGNSNHQSNTNRGRQGRGRRSPHTSIDHTPAAPRWRRHSTENVSVENRRLEPGRRRRLQRQTDRKGCTHIEGSGMAERRNHELCDANHQRDGTSQQPDHTTTHHASQAAPGTLRPQKATPAAATCA